MNMEDKISMAITSGSGVGRGRVGQERPHISPHSWPHIGHRVNNLSHTRAPVEDPTGEWAPQLRQGEGIKGGRSVTC